MKNLVLLSSILFSLFLISCTSSPEKHDVAAPQKKVANDSLVYLKALVKPGDLILRLGDDFLSHQIRYMSHKDQSYSHVGVVVNKNGENVVCHIYPEANNGDTIRYKRIDSFLTPLSTISCAAYRYNLSTAEVQAFVSTLDSFAKNKIHFDKLYDLSTNDKVYCSEMIYKALKKSTNSRVSPQVSFPPANMVSLLLKYFAKEKPTFKEIAQRKFIAIDDLYLMPECKKIISVTLQPTQ